MEKVRERAKLAKPASEVNSDGSICIAKHMITWPSKLCICVCYGYSECIWDGRAVHQPICHCAGQ